MKSFGSFSLGLLLAVANASPHAAGRHRHRQVDETYQPGTPVQNPPVTQPSGGVKGKIEFPSGCLTANGLHIGVNFDNKQDVSTIKNAAGAPPCVVGSYADVLNLDGIKWGAANADAIGAIYMLSLKTIQNVDAQGVITALNKFVADRTGPPMWLRLGHEMNLYVTDLGGHQYQITADQYKSLFNAIAQGVDRSKIKMFWNPNCNPSDYANWYPGAASVDIAGLDTYLMDDTSKYNQGLTQDFCDLYEKHPIFAGEIGAVPGHGGTPAQRLNWATQAASAQVKSYCKSYIGFAWFEMNNEEGDFRTFPNGIMQQALTAASSGSQQQN